MFYPVQDGYASQACTTEKYANYTNNSTAALSNYSINGYNYVTLYYNVPNVNIGSKRVFTITFDTNYGSGQGFIVTQST